jgi:hypothetical protein
VRLDPEAVADQAAVALRGAKVQHLFQQFAVAEQPVIRAAAVQMMLLTT